MEQIYTPNECIRLSQKFDQEQLDSMKDRIYAVTIHGKLSWYTNYAPDLYQIKYDFPLFDVKFLLHDLLCYENTIVNNFEGEYIITFKHKTYSSYNLKELLYTIYITQFENKSKPEL